MSTRSPYATDLCDDEWEILEPLVPRAKPGGRPRAHQTREILNAVPTFMCAVQLRILDDAQGGALAERERGPRGSGELRAPDLRLRQDARRGLELHPLA